MPIVNTRRTSAQERKQKQNSAYNRMVKDSVGGWASTPSGLRAGTVEVVSSGGGERIRVASKIMLSGTTLGEVLDDNEVEITVADGTKFSKGDTIRIDAEHMYVNRVETNTLYVVRGADGTANVAHVTGLDIYKINPKTPTRYSELGSETIKFVKDGSSFNYPKQMQFIPASALNFGSAFSFVNDGDLVDYDDDQYDVLFILKDMQTYSVEGSDENSNQFLQVSAESKSATGFTPTANVGVRVLTTSTVSSFADATFGYAGTPLADPTYETDYNNSNGDAYHDDNTDAVLSLTVTYTLNFSAVKGSGEFLVEGFVRAGTEDTSNTDRFVSSGYSQSSFSQMRDAGFGDGTVTKTANFTFGSGLGTDPCKVVITITNYSQLGGSTATLTGTITEIAYVTASGATRSVTGRNRADAIVIAR